MSVSAFIIVCPMVFLAGIIDSIAGGGGLISLPSFLFAGLPIHTALATNKLSSTCGTGLATFRLVRKKPVSLRLAVPGVLFGLLGSVAGAHFSLLIPEKTLKYLLLALLPAIVFCVMNKRLFKDNPDSDLQFNRRMLIKISLSSLSIGIYDGIYGPGTGTFLIIAFTVFTHMSTVQANAYAKIINLSTNIAALAVFLLRKQVIIPLGAAAAASNMLGNYIGSGLVMKKGAKISRPLIIAVLILLTIKIIVDF